MWYALIMKSYLRVEGPEPVFNPIRVTVIRYPTSSRPIQRHGTLKNYLDNLLTGLFNDSEVIAVVAETSKSKTVYSRIPDA